METGGCPHTAIREDASMNLEAVDEMMERFSGYPDPFLLKVVEIIFPQHSARSL